MSKRMDLLLWRHAEALDGSPDMARELSKHGTRQAAKMGQWLSLYAPEKLRLMVSPAVRTRQTAEFFRKDMEICDALAPGAPVSRVLEATGWPDADGAVLIVGHQPTLGQLGAFLLSGTASPWAFKKGALWWLSHRVRNGGEAQTVLKLALSPEAL